MKFIRKLFTLIIAQAAIVPFDVTDRSAQGLRAAIRDSRTDPVLPPEGLGQLDEMLRYIESYKEILCEQELIKPLVEFMLKNSENPESIPPALIDSFWTKMLLLLRPMRQIDEAAAKKMGHPEINGSALIPNSAKSYFTPCSPDHILQQNDWISMDLSVVKAVKDHFVSTDSLPYAQFCALQNAARREWVSRDKDWRKRKIICHEDAYPLLLYIAYILNQTLNEDRLINRGGDIAGAMRQIGKPAKMHIQMACALIWYNYKGYNIIAMSILYVLFQIAIFSCTGILTVDGLSAAAHECLFIAFYQCCFMSLLLIGGIMNCVGADSYYDIIAEYISPEKMMEIIIPLIKKLQLDSAYNTAVQKADVFLQGIPGGTLVIDGAKSIRDIINDILNSEAGVGQFRGRSLLLMLPILWAQILAFTGIYILFGTSGWLTSFFINSKTINSIITMNARILSVLYLELFGMHSLPLWLALNSSWQASDKLEKNKADTSILPFFLMDDYLIVCRLGSWIFLGFYFYYFQMYAMNVILAILICLVMLPMVDPNEIPPVGSA